jgi:hemerythrin superfamily protein
MFGKQKSETHAITLLKNDHATVDALFKEWERAEDKPTKASLVNDICNALSVHAKIEEEIFYPQAMNVLDRDGDDLIREAAVEHGTLKGLIQRIADTGPSDDMFEAHVKVLMEYVKHHVKEEENEMFPKIERTELDLEELGARLMDRKADLELIVESAPKPRRGAVAIADLEKSRQRSRSTSASRDAA